MHMLCAQLSVNIVGLTVQGGCYTYRFKASSMPSLLAQIYESDGGCGLSGESYSRMRCSKFGKRVVVFISVVIAELYLTNYHANQRPSNGPLINEFTHHNRRTLRVRLYTNRSMFLWTGAP